MIEESETLQLKTAVETHERLTAMLPGLTVGLVHGRQKPAEKAAARMKACASCCINTRCRKMRGNASR